MLSSFAVFTVYINVIVARREGALRVLRPGAKGIYSRAFLDVLFQTGARQVIVHDSRSAGISRRRFLTTLGAAGLSLLTPGTALAQKHRSKSPAGLELATLLDLSKCTGCGACVEACRRVNAAKFPHPEGPIAPTPSGSPPVEDWSARREVTDRLTPYNWLFIQTARGSFEGEKFQIHIPRRCMHCQNPPCANLCPWGAAAREDNGAVRIDPGACVGGGKCQDVCPWGFPMRQSGVGPYLKILPRFFGNGVMYMCDRCQDRVAVGGLPACVDACPNGVQEMGPRAEITARAHALARNMSGYVYGDTENGGTNTFYVSPVPFEILDAAVRTGPGRPRLAAPADVAADEDRLAYAALLAPVAGVIAGALRLGSRFAGPEPPARGHGEDADDGRGDSGGPR